MYDLRSSVGNYPCIKEKGITFWLPLVQLLRIWIPNSNNKRNNIKFGKDLDDFQCSKISNSWILISLGFNSRLSHTKDFKNGTW